MAYQMAYGKGGPAYMTPTAPMLIVAPPAGPYGYPPVNPAFINKGKPGKPYYNNGLTGSESHTYKGQYAYGNKGPNLGTKDHSIKGKPAKGKKEGAGNPNSIPLRVPALAAESPSTLVNLAAPKSSPPIQPIGPIQAGLAPPPGAVALEKTEAEKNAPGPNAPGPPHVNGAGAGVPQGDSRPSKGGKIHQDLNSQITGSAHLPGNYVKGQVQGVPQIGGPPSTETQQQSYKGPSYSKESSKGPGPGGKSYDQGKGSSIKGPQPGPQGKGYSPDKSGTPKGYGHSYLTKGVNPQAGAYAPTPYAGPPVNGMPPTGMPPGIPAVPPGHALEITHNKDGTKTYNFIPMGTYNATKGAPFPPATSSYTPTPAPTPAPVPHYPTTEPSASITSTTATNTKRESTRAKDRGPPPTGFNNPDKKSTSKSPDLSKEVLKDNGGDFADRKPEAYRHFTSKYVSPAKDAPGLMTIVLADGMCRDKHVGDFVECLEAWFKRALGEKPYHIRQFDISGNSLSDDSIKSILEALTQLEVRIDLLNLARNKISTQGAVTIADYIWLSDPLSEIDLSNNRLNSEDVNGVLRACYNHKFYPQKAANYSNIPIPFKIDIRANPVVTSKQVPTLMETIKRDGGEDRVWFSNRLKEPGEKEEYISPEELLPHRKRLEKCYLIVHLPGAWKGVDDFSAVGKRKRDKSKLTAKKKRKRQESSDGETSSEG